MIMEDIKIEYLYKFIIKICEIIWLHRVSYQHTL